MIVLVITLVITHFVAIYCFIIPDNSSATLPESQNETNLQEYSNPIALRTAQGTRKASGMVQTACHPTNTCYGDLDCPGGRCLGIAVGKCNCGACVMFAYCSSDRQCGGLEGACTEAHHCDCPRGYEKAGFANPFEALVKICNVRECIPNTPSCYGLPCNAGVCACPI